jgi:ethanolamine permease
MGEVDYGSVVVPENQPPSSVAYTHKDAAYFEKRELRRVAGPWKLWALGVAAVISGEFSGWNLGLAAAGFVGLAIATAVITLMYVLLCLSLAEMAAALPHTGGAYSFARTSMGPWAGFITGMAENLEYIVTPAVIAYFAGSYLVAIFTGVPILGALPDYAWWLILYAAFVGLNVLGAQISFRFSIAITIAALVILVVFFVGAIPHVDVARHAMDVPPAQGHSPTLPFGIPGILFALPFAVWFYLGIEELPLAAEETHAPARDLPRGILSGMATLVVFALLTLFFNSSIPPGAAKLGTSGEPLLDGLRTIFGEVGGRALGLVATAGLIASFHGIIFAYGRQIYSLSRAGYFPQFLSLTHRTRKTPYAALILGAALGLAALCTIRAVSPADAGAIIGGRLIAMAVFGAMISYVLQMTSFVFLRRRFPALARPYVSGAGVLGAIVAALIALVTLVTLFLTNADYRAAAWGAAAWYAAGLVYFGVHSRRRLVLSPEEAFAIAARQTPEVPERRLLDSEPRHGRDAETSR